jgi:hypothetical protein
MSINIARRVLESEHKAALGSTSRWALSREYCLNHIEVAGSILTSDPPKYRRFLRAEGLTENDAFFAQSILSNVINEGQIVSDLVVRAIGESLRVLFDDYTQYLGGSILMHDASEDRISSFVQELVFMHLDWLQRPSLFGSAVEIEISLIQNERLITQIFPEFASLSGWAYLEFLDQDEMFTESIWPKSHFQQLTDPLRMHWVKYLNTVHQRCIGYSAENEEALLTNLRKFWSAQIERVGFH